MKQQVCLLIVCLAARSLADLVAPDGEKLVSKGDTKKEQCSAEENSQCRAAEDRSCWDGFACCEEWGRRNQCEMNKDWMKKNCKITCKACKTERDTTGCKDFYPECGKWAGEGECKSNKEWMDNNCREACKSCDQFTKDNLKKNCKI